MLVSAEKVVGMDFLGWGECLFCDVPPVHPSMMLMAVRAARPSARHQPFLAGHSRSSSQASHDWGQLPSEIRTRRTPSGPSLLCSSRRAASPSQSGGMSRKPSTAQPAAVMSWTRLAAHSSHASLC